MSVTTVDVVGTAPLSFTDSTGAQQFVPLSALQFEGSKVTVRSSWSASFDAAETITLLAVAASRVAAGELAPPPTQPPAPAIALTAARTGPETSNIEVTVTPDSPSPLTAKLTFQAVETDTYSGLDTAATAAARIGVDTPAGAESPPAGTGVVVIKASSVSTSKALPVKQEASALTGAGFAVKDKDDKTLFTMLPRPGYAGTGGISVAVTVDPSATTFTVTATYDSDKETGTNSTVTLTSLGALPAKVAYLVTASAPPGGAALPAAGTVRLAGGAPGIAAAGLLYTS
jgi:hypothetical protein